MNEVRFLGGRLEDYADYVLQEGDLLFTRYNGNPALTGVCGMIRIVTRPTVHPDKLIRVKIVPEICLPAFAEVVLSAGASRDFIAGRVRTTAGQAGISGEDIRSTPIPLAPLSEQSRIVAEVERRLSVIDEVEMQVEANLKRAERLRQAILKRAFEGKLVPQDPNDEPASMLLERIKGARRERT
jgi:type I restriction enzyme S subunit